MWLGVWGKREEIERDNSDVNMTIFYDRAFYNLMKTFERYATHCFEWNTRNW